MCVQFPAKSPRNKANTIRIGLYINVRPNSCNLHPNSRKIHGVFTTLPVFTSICIQIPANLMGVCNTITPK